jgi:hypothetical protein
MGFGDPAAHAGGTDTLLLIMRDCQYHLRERVGQRRHEAIPNKSSNSCGAPKLFTPAGCRDQCETKSYET